MRVLITGGAGFIGSNLADRLMADGLHVTVIDDLSVGTIDNIDHLLPSDRFSFIHDSILNRDALERLIRRADAVYHLAAVVGVPYVLDDPIGGITINVRGTENVLALAAQYDVRTVIASSSEVYGKSTAMPLQEDADRLLGPTSVDRWSYADSKAIDEYMAFGYARQGLAVSAVRYFNVYGPRLDPRGYGSVIAKFISQARCGEPLTVYGDGVQTRSFTYVDDVVEGTIRAATVEAAAGLAFNIGSNCETSINRLAQLILEAVGAEGQIHHVPYDEAYGARFEDTPRRVPDVSRARDVLGFEARTSLREGLARTVSWFERHVP